MNDVQEFFSKHKGCEVRRKITSNYPQATACTGILMGTAVSDVMRVHRLIVLATDLCRNEHADSYHTKWSYKTELNKSYQGDPINPDSIVWVVLERDVHLMQCIKHFSPQPATKEEAFPDPNKDYRDPIHRSLDRGFRFLCGLNIQSSREVVQLVRWALIDKALSDAAKGLPMAYKLEFPSDRNPDATPSLHTSEAHSLLFNYLCGLNLFMRPIEVQMEFDAVIQDMRLSFGTGLAEMIRESVSKPFGSG